MTMVKMLHVIMSYVLFLENISVLHNLYSVLPFRFVFNGLFSKEKKLFHAYHLQLKTSFSILIYIIKRNRYIRSLFIRKWKLLFIFVHDIIQFYEYFSMTPLFSYRINVTAINMLKKIYVFILIKYLVYVLYTRWKVYLKITQIMLIKLYCNICQYDNPFSYEIVIFKSCESRFSFLWFNYLSQAWNVGKIVPTSLIN